MPFGQHQDTESPCPGADQKARGLWERDWVLLCCTSDIFKRLLLGTTNVAMYYSLTARLEKQALQP